VLIDLIARGVRAGEVSDAVDPELATAALLGAVFYRRLMTERPFDPDDDGLLLDQGSAVGAAPAV
jgi:hypothetical protein